METILPFLFGFAAVQKQALGFLSKLAKKVAGENEFLQACWIENFFLFCPPF